MPYISELNDPMMGYETYEASLSAYTENQWWSSNVGGVSVTNQYELNYWHEWSELTMLFDSAFASYKIYDFDFNEVAEDADFWLTFNAFAGNTKGKVSMDQAKFNNPNAQAPESFIVFYDESGKALAGVCCKYTATGGSQSGPTLSIVSGNATISNITEQNNPDLYWGLASNLSVTSIFDVQTSVGCVFEFSSAIASVSICDMSLTPSTAVTVNLMGSMFMIPAPTVNGTECIIVLKDANTMNIAAIHYCCAW